MHGACERARQWASADVDGELSKFERVLLGAHLGICPSCREFHTGVAGLTTALRLAPLEPLERFIQITRIRRRPRLRLASAAAAMAVTLVWLGSSLVSSDLGSRFTSASAPTASSYVDTMNLSTARALETVSPVAARGSRAHSRASLGGGPVVRER